MRKLFLMAAICCKFWVADTHAQQRFENQPDPCLVSSLNIGTGYNPATGLLVNPGNADPRWKVSYISPDLYGGAASGFVALNTGAAIIYPNYQWNASAQSQYVSCIYGNNFTTVPNRTYRTYLDRTITVCQAGDFAFSFDYAADDTLSIYIDGVFKFKTLTSHGQKFDNCTLNLAQGPHTIRGVLANGNWGNPGYFGGRISGTVTSVSGIPSLVAESGTCSSYTCATTGVSNPNSGNSGELEIRNLPGQQQFIVQLPDENGTLMVLDAAGRQVFTETMTAHTNRTALITPNGWAKGLYLIVYRTAAGRYFSGKVQL